MKTKYLTGALFCLLATITWGAMFPVMTSVLNYIDPFTFTSMRYSIAGLVFVILLVKREGVSSLSFKGEKIFLAWILGSLGFAGFGFLVFLGQQLIGKTGALPASIIMATMPMLGLLVTWLFKGKRPPLFSFLFIAMSFLGVSLVLTKGNYSELWTMPAHYAADIPLLLGALCWVIYTVGASLFPHWSPYKYTAVTTLLGLVTVYFVNIVLIKIGISKIPDFDVMLIIMPHLFYMALIAGFVGVLCWNLGNKIITPMNGVLFMDVVPLTAFVISTLIGVVPQRVQIIGAGITAGALVINNLYQRTILSRQAKAYEPVELRYQGKSDELIKFIPQKMRE